jgi:hypothetical protein
MSDDELVRGFEGDGFAPGAFRHAEHVRLTWILLARHGRADAERRLLTGLRALAARAGKPEKFDEALTRAWLAEIDHVRCQYPQARSFEDAVAACPGLLDKALVTAALRRG